MPIRRPQISRRDRRNRRRRCAAQELRRRGGRPGQLLPLYARPADTDGNQRFIDGMLKNYDTVPGQYAGLLYVNCQVVEAALKAAGGSTERQREVHGGAQGGEPHRYAARAAQVRSSRQRGRQLLHPPHRTRKAPNTASSSGTRRIKTYENVSQFWTWPEKEYPGASGLFARLSAADEVLKHP